MNAVLNVILLLVSVGFIYGSCVWLVKSVTKIARYFKLSDFFIGFVLVGFATSIPELVVGITSALRGVPDLSLGNVLGTNIADITIIFGLVVLLARVIPIHGKIERRDILVTGIISILPILLAIDGNLSRPDGIILVSVFVLYVFLLLRQKQYFDRPKQRELSRRDFFISLASFAVALAILICASRGVVEYGSVLAMQMGVPLIFIGLVFVAIGTSLPELAFETSAAIKGKPLMAVGDILGSIAVNSALIIGVTALISPLALAGEYGNFIFPSLAFVASYIIFAIFLRTKSKLTWREGIILVFLYLAFIAISTLLVN